MHRFKPSQLCQWNHYNGIVGVPTKAKNTVPVVIRLNYAQQHQYNTVTACQVLWWIFVFLCFLCLLCMQRCTERLGGASSHQSCWRTHTGWQSAPAEKPWSSHCLLPDYSVSLTCDPATQLSAPLQTTPSPWAYPSLHTPHRPPVPQWGTSPPPSYPTVTLHLHQHIPCEALKKSSCTLLP